MNRRHFPVIALALAGLLLAGCRDRSDPVKPTVSIAGLSHSTR